MNGSFLPFVQFAAQLNSTRPFASLSALPGPFFGQYANMVNYGMDVCKVNFINT